MEDKNDIFEYLVYREINDSFGCLGTLFTALYFLSIGLGLLFMSGCLILGIFGLL